MKKEISYLDISSDIKKAKEEEVVNNTVDKIITEDIADAIGDEMPNFKNENRDEIGITENIESVVEKLDINFDVIERQEAKEKLIEYSNKINDYMKPYGLRTFVEPKGEGGIDYNKEFDSFYEKIKDYLDEDQNISDEEFIEKCSSKNQEIADREYADMCPTFIYPEIENIDEEKLKETKKKLEELKDEIDIECKNENTKKYLTSFYYLQMH